MDCMATFPWIAWQHSHGLHGNIPVDWLAEIRGIRNLPALFSFSMRVTGLFWLVTSGAHPGSIALDRGYTVSLFVSSLISLSQ